MCVQAWKDTGPCFVTNDDHGATRLSLSGQAGPPALAVFHRRAPKG